MNMLYPHPTRRDSDGMAIIGRTLHDLRGIRHGEGDGGNTPPAEQQQTPPAAPQTPPPAPAAPAPAAPSAAPVAPAPVNYRGDPDEYVRELRNENKTAREAREKAEAEYATEKAERESAASARDSLARENHILRTAPKFGANADLLLDSSSFMKNFADVDLNDEAAVKKAIEDALERNSAFKTGPALPPSSGGGHQGGQPPTATPTLESAARKHFGG